MRLPLLFLAATPLFAQECASLAASLQPGHMSAAPGDVNLTVTAPAACFWTFVSDSSWLGVTAGPAGGVGSGNGNVTWRAALNILPVQRQAIVTVTGYQTSGQTTQTFKLTQDGAPLSNVRLEPASAAYGVAGGNGSFQVTTAWYWSAGGAPAWISIPASTGGSSTGTVNYTVAANPCADPRTGTIVIQPGSAASPPQAFPITQSGAPENLSLTPASATLSSAAFDGRIAVTTGVGCGWTAYSNTPNWLTITAGASNGPNGILYHASENKAATPRTGHIAVGTQTFVVTQQGAAAATPQLTAVVNAASYAGGGVSPGEVVALGGTNLGPLKGLLLQLDPGGQSVTKMLGTTTVLFDGAPAALTYVSAAQVNAIVPYSVAGKDSTQVQVQYQGALSNAMTLPVLAASPGIFALDASGAGAGAILNGDYSVNGALNPAARGSWVMIYATGGGVTNPASEDGAITGTNAAQLPRLTQGVTVTIDGLPAESNYAGGAPGAVAGLTQINARIPAGARTGQPVAVVVKVGDLQSQPGITIFVK